MVGDQNHGETRTEASPERRLGKVPLLVLCVIGVFVAYKLFLAVMQAIVSALFL